MGTLLTHMVPLCELRKGCLLSRWLVAPQAKGNGNPLQYSCLENSVDRGTWWAAVHGVAQSRTQLKWLSMHACIGEGNGNPFQYSWLENPRDRGAWWAAVYAVAQSQTRLKQPSSSSSSKGPGDSSLQHSLLCLKPTSQFFPGKTVLALSDSWLKSNEITWDESALLNKYVSC